MEGVSAGMAGRRSTWGRRGNWGWVGVLVMELVKKNRKMERESVRRKWEVKKVERFIMAQQECRSPSL